MDNISGKISPYDLLNVLFPGVLAVAFYSWCFEVSISAIDVVSSAVYFCITYLVGIIVSRIGSLIIEPLFKKFGFITWHKNYYKAERRDSKISILLKVMNMYRTLVALIVSCCVLSLAATFFTRTITCCTCLQLLLMLFAIMILFSMSYIKQSKAIYRRVDSFNKKELQ